MTYYGQARRLMRWRNYIVLGLVLLGIAMTGFGDRISRALVRTCDAAPAYAPEVPADVRARLDALHAAGLLYCSAPVQGLATVDGPVYWGTDGTRSLLFFQARDLAGVGVVRYGFGQSFQNAFLPATTGASAQAALKEDLPGRPAFVNQAPEGARYFLREQGAPDEADAVVAVTIRGPALRQPGVSGRDAFRDIEMLWARLRREPVAEVTSTAAQIAIPVVPGTWIEKLRHHVAPELAGPDGRPSPEALDAAAPKEPTYYRTAAGLLGTTVWVAGVVSSTTPSLVLVPDGEEPVPADARSGWISLGSGTYLTHFAFPPQPTGRSLSARYRGDPDDPSTEVVWRLVAP